MTAPDLTAIRARAEAATSGPWGHGPAARGNPTDGPDCFRVRATVGRDAEVVVVAEMDYDHMGARDAEFIAHARDDVPALLAEVEGVRMDARIAEAEVERLGKAYEVVVDGYWADVSECQKRAEKAEARAQDFEDRYETSHASRMHAEDAFRRVEAERDRLRAAVDAVRALHHPLVNSLSALYPRPLCACGMEAPCPTLAALDEHLGQP